jgi:hypothetical protein
LNINNSNYKLGHTFVSIVSIQLSNSIDVRQLIDSLRMVSNRVLLQAVDTNYIYGIEHILEVLKITLEYKRRKIIFTKRVEIDLLLRLLCTDQVTVALEKAMIRTGKPGCFVMFSNHQSSLLKLANQIQHLSICINNDVLSPNKTKRKIISDNIGLTNCQIFSDEGFFKYLIEKAALIIKR